MAEGILFDLAANILAKIRSLAVEEINILTGVPKKIDKLEGTMSTIRAVLLDAQERQFTSHEVKDWLMKLEDVMYELDDLLDSVSTEKLWREAKTRDKKAKKACIFFSSSNKLVFRHKIGQKIISIKEKLDAIAIDRAQFHFNERLVENCMGRRERTLTESFVHEENVIGRNQDKEVILDFLLNQHVEGKVLVKSICGIGGLGKTTLAQFVYNDKQVKTYFELRKWVSVSNDFDVTSIAKAIIGSEIHDSEVKTNLVEKLYEKRFLIVLDDVWNYERAKWLDLMTLLDGGARGSKVLVTTREEKVAKVCGDTIEPYFIEGVNLDQSWAIFCKFAFVGGQEPLEKNLIEIGKEIVRKCRGVPLAIRVLGSMLYGIKPTYWSSFLNSKLSSIDQFRDNIMPILQVSFDNLPSHLKNCFAYCALFPQDYLYDMEKVVDLWIAQGYIPLLSKSLEDTGYLYCKELIERSFFQLIEDNSKLFKMHDLMHDLASSVSGIMHREEPHRKVRHIRRSSWHESFNSTKLRSLVYYTSHSLRRIDLRSVCIDLCSVCEATSLRVLDLSEAPVRKVPDCIAKLKHLRYINLSTTLIFGLPKSIGRLQNLRTLILDNCGLLTTLPRGLTKLVNLKHLSMIDCYCDMPSGLDKLTSLETLTRVYLGKERGKVNLGELNRLNRLKGSIEIDCRMLETLSHSEAKDANLEGKQNIRCLTLEHVRNNNMLESFRPHANLEKLDVINFDGVFNIPNWLTTLTNLVSICLRISDTCKYLPPLHQLPALKTLQLSDLRSLKYIADDRGLSSSLAASFFPSLEELLLEELPKLKAWWKTQTTKDGNGDKSASTSICPHDNDEQHLPYQFPRLSHLEIDFCPVITSIPASQVQITNLSLIRINESLRHNLKKQGVQLPEGFNKYMKK